MSKLSQSIASLASKVGLLGRRRAAEQESPEEYARAYGGSYHQPRDYVRNSGGYVIRGPYYCPSGSDAGHGQLLIWRSGRRAAETVELAPATKRLPSQTCG